MYLESYNKRSQTQKGSAHNLQPVRLAYQPPTTSQQYFSLRTNQHQPSATNQPNRLLVCLMFQQLMNHFKNNPYDFESVLNHACHAAW
jgi:hypothetical protein